MLSGGPQNGTPHGPSSPEQSVAAQNSAAQFGYVAAQHAQGGPGLGGPARRSWSRRWAERRFVRDRAERQSSGQHARSDARADAGARSRSEPVPAARGAAGSADPGSVRARVLGRLRRGEHSCAGRVRTRARVRAAAGVTGPGPGGGAGQPHYQPSGPPLQAVRVQQPVAIALPDAVKAAHAEGYTFGESVGRDAPGLWLEAVLARKPRMPSDLEARLLQGSVLPIDSLLHDEVRHSLRRGFWDALESARR